MIQNLLTAKVYDAAEPAFGAIALVFVLVFAQSIDCRRIIHGAWNRVVE
jgi:hypothetical protein